MVKLDVCVSTLKRNDHWSVIRVGVTLRQVNSSTPLFLDESNCRLCIHNTDSSKIRPSELKCTNMFWFWGRNETERDERGRRENKGITTRRSRWMGSKYNPSIMSKRGNSKVIRYLNIDKNTGIPDVYGL